MWVYRLRLTSLNCEKVIRAVFLFALLVSILPGCEPIYYDVPVENEPAFKSGESFFFESSSGSRDTVTVIFSKDYRVSDKRYHYENVYIQYNWIDRGTSTEELKFRYEIGFGPILNGFDFVEYIESYNLSSGATSHGVFRYQANTAEKKVRELYIHARYGILEFTKPDGEVMIRVFD
jgi:hypothetical protein